MTRRPGLLRRLAGRVACGLCGHDWQRALSVPLARAYRWHWQCARPGCEAVRVTYEEIEE